jgi:pilus assembly protein CpaF
MGLRDRVKERDGGLSNGKAGQAEPSKDTSSPKPAADAQAGTATAAAAATQPEVKPHTGPKGHSAVRKPEVSRDRGERKSLGAQAAERKQSGPPKDQIGSLKVRIHSELIDRLDLTAIGKLSPDQAQDQIRSVIVQLLDADGMPLSREDRKRLEAEITSEVLGFGPLDALLRDDTISDILVNSASQTYVERRGKLEMTNVVFRDDDHLIQIIDRIVSKVGRRIDTSSPLCDARLPDGSRVNAIVPPISLDGPSLSIRRFGKDPLHINDLVSFGSMTDEVAALLEAIVKARLNIVVSGGTGSGKTTLLNCCSSFIPHDERVVTIEDAAEIQLQQPHVVRLETRPNNIEGRGMISSRDLVKNALRMRPDRIVVGEVRGGEALDMLQAMNTGHDGSITTLHANSPRDCLSRLEMMILMAGVELPVQAMRQQISSAVDVILQQSRLRDGSRRVMKVTEIVGMEGDIITAQDIFEYVITGLSEDGKVEGHFQCTGIRPNFITQLEAAGCNFGPEFFAPRTL